MRDLDSEWKSRGDGGDNAEFGIWKAGKQRSHAFLPYYKLLEAAQWTGFAGI